MRFKYLIFESIGEPNDYGNRGPGPMQVKAPWALHLWLQDAPSGTDLGAPQMAIRMKFMVSELGAGCIPKAGVGSALRKLCGLRWERGGPPEETQNALLRRGTRVAGHVGAGLILSDGVERPGAGESGNGNFHSSVSTLSGFKSHLCY